MNKMLTLFISLITLICLVGCSQERPKTILWNEYHGTIDNYSVMIEESQHEGEPTVTRIVHLTPINSPSYIGITGHDYNGDFRWDRVFRCGYPDQTNGCNSYVFKANGTKIWEPCPMDKDRVKPFTDAEVEEAINLLHKAMTVVHRDVNRVNMLTALHQ